MIYSSHISWSSPTTPTPWKSTRRWAFDRPFRDEVGQSDKSVLDSVLERRPACATRSASPTQRRLDEYLASVREVEQRIDQAAKIAACKAGGRPSSNPTCRAPQTASLRTSTKHNAPNVRHPGPRLPHDTTAPMPRWKTEQRPLVVAFSRFEGGLY